MKSLFKKLAVTAVLSAMTFGFSAGNAQAAIYTFNPIHDISVSYTEHDDGTEFYFHYNSHNDEMIWVYNQLDYGANYYRSNAYLKFDLNNDINGKTANPLTERVVSAKLMAFASLQSDVGTYYNLNSFDSNNWDETVQELPPENVFKTTRTTDLSSYIQKSIYCGPPDWIEWNIPLYYSKNYFLDTNNLISFEIEKSSYYDHSFYPQAYFWSRDTNYAPQLIIETVPIPEPSSIFLSVMGIAGAMRLRKKK